MRPFVLVALLALPAVVAPTTTAAQTPRRAATAPRPDPAIAALRGQWQSVTDNIIKSAEQMPEADYAYKPVASVRSFGQLIGHVAGAQFTMCAAALGDTPRDEDAIEQAATTKAALIAALRESTTYCGRAYAQSGTAASVRTDLYGEKVPRLNALVLNAVHNGEHYGNIITYLRMKGMVPPSSQR